MADKRKPEYVANLYKEDGDFVDANTFNNEREAIANAKDMVENGDVGCYATVTKEITLVEQNVRAVAKKLK